MSVGDLAVDLDLDLLLARVEDDSAGGSFNDGTSLRGRTADVGADSDNLNGATSEGGGGTERTSGGGGALSGSGLSDGDQLDLRRDSDDEILLGSNLHNSLDGASSIRFLVYR